MNSLRRLVQAIRVSSGISEKASGISGAQLYVLRALSQESGLSLNDLAKRTATDKSSVSVVVQKLVDRGLIQKNPSNADKRRVELSITAKGTKLLGKVPPPAQEHLIKAIYDLPDKPKHELAKLLHRLITQAELDNTDAVMFFEESKSQ